MNARVAYIAVGLFVLCLGVALIAGILWLATGGPREGHDLYVTYMQESVSGLSPDAFVKYRGVNVGRVREIGLNPNNPQQVRLLLEIRHGTPIRNDTYATLEFQGLTGLAFVNLSGGTVDSPPLEAEPGESYPVIQSRSSLFARLDDKLSELLAGFLKTMQQIDFLLDDANREAFAQTLKSLSALAGVLAGRSEMLGDTLDHIGVTSRNVGVASQRLPRLLSQMEKSAGALEETLRDAERKGLAMQRAIEHSTENIERHVLHTLVQIEELVAELRATAASLHRVSRQMEQDPSVLIYGRPSPPPGPGEETGR